VFLCCRAQNDVKLDVVVFFSQAARPACELISIDLPMSQKTDSVDLDRYPLAFFFLS
jgi:hypothetical protein